MKYSFQDSKEKVFVITPKNTAQKLTVKNKQNHPEIIIIYPSFQNQLARFSSNFDEM